MCVSIFGLVLLLKPVLGGLVIGIFLIYIGTSSLGFINRMRKRGMRCSGWIVKYMADSSGYKTPLVQFTTADGRKMKAQPYIYAATKVNGGKNGKAADRSISVLYSAGDASKFIVEEEIGFSTFIFTLFILGGLLFAGLSIARYAGWL